MSLEEDLQKQLRASPETEVLGVVSASGVSGGSGAAPTDPWTLLLSFSGWRERGGPIQNAELTVRKEVAKREITRFQNAVHPFDVLRVRVRLAKETVFGSPQALLIRSLGKDHSDPELLDYAKQLQEPVSFQDFQFGLFTLDRRVNWYESITDWGGLKVRLTINATDSEGIEKCLAHARRLWASQKGWQQQVTAYAVGKLLQLKNEAWLGEDETDLTAEEFADKMILEAISTRMDGSFEFWHKDGDLFWGHSIMVSGNLKDGLKDARIEG